MFTPVLLAQTTQSAGHSLTSQPTTGTTEPPGYAKPGGWGTYFPFIILGVMMVMIMLRSGKGKGKDQKRQRELLGNLKKGDRIQTVGGILGTVVELRENNEVVIKVDENNNTKVRFSRNAIHRVFEENETPAGKQP